ncbi:MAG: ribosylnicotinamide kinase [Alectoria sarmentosa]|nr:MAG: ribosylnicotinamide kinase [Alectoria sarmentosa]
MPTSRHPDPTSSKPPLDNAKRTQPTTSSSAQPPILVLALSGPTSSGKTTLATALHEIFPPPHSLTVHADDFYKPDSQIPTKDGVQDWDCAGSLDLERFRDVLRTIKEGGEAPADLVRQGNFEDGVHGVKGIEPEVIERMKREVEAWPEAVKGRKLVIVDGFLLFGQSIPAPLRDLFDIKFLLRASYEDAKRRRENRNGYVTLEGFWQDPPGYFDRVVWPNYLEEHGDLFRFGADDPDGPLDEARGSARRICFSDPHWGLERCLEWIVGVMRREIEGLDSGNG